MTATAVSPVTITVPIRTRAARKIKGTSGVPNTSEYHFVVPVESILPGLRQEWSPNPREVNSEIDRGVYKEVAESLLGRDGSTAPFYLKNRGLVVFASDVEQDRSDPDLYHLTLARGDYEFGDGLCDGGHTLKVITDACDKSMSGALSDDESAYLREQSVRVIVHVGIHHKMITDAARGLNTGIQVKAVSLTDMKGYFKWLKKILDAQPYGTSIGYTENSDREVNVQEVLSLLYAMNIELFPANGPTFPVSAYSGKATVLKAFITDVENDVENKEGAKFSAMTPVIPDILRLYDIIRDTAGTHYGAAAFGRMKMSDTKDGEEKHRLVYLNKPSKHPSVLRPAAALPMLSAFRWALRINEAGVYEWAVPGGFDGVVAIWESIAAKQVERAYDRSVDAGHSMTSLGKDKSLWDITAMGVQVKVPTV